MNVTWDVLQQMWVGWIGVVIQTFLPKDVGLFSI